MQQQKIIDHNYEKHCTQIICDDQNYISSNTKTQQFIIPLLDDTSNKNNKIVLII
jgi:hypothetical protein